MRTLKEVLNGREEYSQDLFVRILDEVRELGEIDEIRERTDEDLFRFFVAGNLVGGWKADGWWELICNYPQWVSYIPQTLEILNLPEMKKAFERVIDCFPESTVFAYTDTYIDTVNFLQNVRFKISDEYLNGFSKDRRKEMSEELHKSIDELEELTEEVWGYQAKEKGWGSVIDFVERVKG